MYTDVGCIIFLVIPRLQRSLPKQKGFLSCSLPSMKDTEDSCQVSLCLICTPTWISIQEDYM